MKSEISTWHAIQDHWDPTPVDSKRSTTLNSCFSSSISMNDTHSSSNHNRYRFHDQGPQSQRKNTHYTPASECQANTVPFSFSNPTLYHPQPLMFTSDSLAYLQDATTLRPPDTLEDDSNMFSERNTTADSRRKSLSPSPSSPTPTPTKNARPTRSRRKPSKQTTSPPSPFRLRRTATASAPAPAPPGSARATYLAKNRQAASKCRNKQKLRQDELVDTAREGERRNKALKVEVERLRGDVRQLMDIAEVHGGCADQRLRMYVERKREEGMRWGGDGGGGDGGGGDGGGGGA